MTSLEEADKKVHKVEDQWHYPIMTKYGFVPITEEATGLVRFYDYTHPNGGPVVRCTTGYHGDYFTAIGALYDYPNYWADLEPFLKGLKL